MAREVTFNRTNRRQNIMEFTACAPATGACRVVVHEEWTPSWVSESSDDAVPDGQQALSLGVGAHGLAELLPVRHERESCSPR